MKFTKRFLQTDPFLLIITFIQHISADAELAILQLSRSSETHQTSSIKGTLPNLRASFQSTDSLYILTSYLPGGTLSDLMIKRQESKLTSIQDHQYERIVKQWIMEIVLGLDWLHTQHYWVHRDLKPSNILLSLDGHIVLNDFGTAAPLIKVLPPCIDQYHWEKFHEEIVYEFPRLLVPKSFSRTLLRSYILIYIQSWISWIVIQRALLRMMMMV
ncbi:uncharacterized protein MELLADRAFT_86600 [Melampsora larici-populina 98AG31]|uniref:Protein kinase domain-containing protein n=1 Tax=Melampsora larici-populina (strain 98AG31 / pathotype 3-4-7) TaxID=747676 RepID=F4RME2_MELLP|nr:uncharacterized protein MELLADRAFT_86600 [Melampsora larici-populina 98AG31]EGG06412.1 hypothetical protein MELLADRAFT_86600 [Melampsora larici-populina 98AG31]